MEMAEEKEPLNFEAIVVKYDKRLFNMIYRMLGDYEEAQDLTQEAFLLAYKSFSKFRGESDVYTWLYQIGLNLCRKFYRRRRLAQLFRLKKEKEFIKNYLSLENLSSIESTVKENLLRNLIQERVRGLPNKYKEAIILRYYQNLSYEEMAKILKLSLGTIKSRLARGRSILEKRIKPYL